MLANCMSDNQRDWNEWLPHLAFCYNASVHESTKYSPFFLMHGAEPRWDVDIQLEEASRPSKSVNAYAGELLSSLEKAHTLTWNNL